MNPDDVLLVDWRQKPSTITDSDGCPIEAFINRAAFAALPADKDGKSFVPDGCSGVFFFSPWAHNMDVINEVKDCKIVRMNNVYVQGFDKPFACYTDQATSLWLNGRAWTIEPFRDDNSDERVLVRRLLVKRVSREEMQAEYNKQVSISRTHGFKGTLRFERIDDPFDVFIDRYINEPGRKRTVDTIHFTSE